MRTSFHSTSCTWIIPGELAPTLHKVACNALSSFHMSICCNYPFLSIMLTTYSSSDSIPHSVITYLVSCWVTDSMHTQICLQCAFLPRNSHVPLSACSDLQAAKALLQVVGLIVRDPTIYRCPSVSEDCVPSSNFLGCPSWHKPRSFCLKRPNVFPMTRLCRSHPCLPTYVVCII